VTDVGTAPEMKKKELEDALAGFLAAQQNELADSLLDGDMIMFFDWLFWGT
jgi:hypothetical protein